MSEIFHLITLKNTTYCFRYADQVSVGDEVAFPKDDEFLPTKLVNVSSFTMPGICHLKFVFIFGNLYYFYSM